ncbi:MAG TPA: DUF4065 domain-containing protein [Candidatus Scatomorpha intestinipullorum]|nr:DUF4065 domain-containing protein [Candidatus Scatomorpha intestinipullorum]
MLYNRKKIIGGAIMYDALEVAKYIINKAIEIEKPISNLQLQKILYFTHLESLKQGEKLIGEPFEAWDFGPVVRKVYNKFCLWGANRLAFKEECTIKNLPKLDDMLVKLIQTPAWELVERSHNPNGAWAKAYQEGSKNIIADSYIQQEARR